MPSPIRNWSGSIEFTPGEIFRPGDEHEVIEFVQRAREQGRRLRPIGSGHSSTPLNVTDDAIVSLERMSGLIDADPDAGLATVLPGTGLADLGSALADVDLGP